MFKTLRDTVNLLYFITFWSVNTGWFESHKNFVMHVMIYYLVGRFSSNHISYLLWIVITIPEYISLPDHIFIHVCIYGQVLYWKSPKSMYMLVKNVYIYISDNKLFGWLSVYSHDIFFPQNLISGIILTLSVVFIKFTAPARSACNNSISCLFLLH